MPLQLIYRNSIDLNLNFMSLLTEACAGIGRKCNIYNKQYIYILVNMKCMHVFFLDKSKAIIIECKGQ